MSSAVETFQISLEQAEAYEANFVPALFGEWATHLVDAAGAAPGQDVLDVACGTGIVAREVADRVAGRGRVVGLDLNEAMLTVARRIRPEIEWVQGDAAELPFASGSFDVALCQSGLMFMPDRAAALRELARVIRPDGTVGVQVWAGLESQPAYGPFYDVVARHAGPQALELVGSYWVLGDLDLLGSLLEAAGLEITSTRTHTSRMRFGSVEQAVRTEVESTPLIERINDEVFAGIVADCESELARFRVDEGVELPIVGHVVVARKRPGS